jgi:hypothetical protein
LNLKQSAEWKYPSNSRFHYHIINSSLLVSETCEESCDLSKYVIEAPSDQLFQVCDTLISGNRYQAEAAERLEQFRAEMPMKRLASFLLDATYEQ